MKRDDTRKGRFYETPEGERYPSVTSILSVIGKPALIAWSANMERELVLEASAGLYSDLAKTQAISRSSWILSLKERLGKERAHQKLLAKAGDIGSQAHALVEWSLRCKMLQQVGPSPEASDPAKWAHMAWEDWAKKVHLKPLLIEQQVYSDTHKYAGTMDLLAEIDGIVTVVDFKTGKAIYPEAHLQVAAYMHAIREMGHASPDQGIIVRLPKVYTDPNFEAVVADPELESMATFLHAKRLWEWTKAKDTWEPKSDTKPTSNTDQHICAQVAGEAIEA